MIFKLYLLYYIYYNKNIIILYLNNGLIFNLILGYIIVFYMS